MLRPTTALLLILLCFCFGDAALQAQQAPPDRKRTDLYGDPLPEGAIARVGTLRFRFGEPVTEIVFGPDGETFAVVTRDGTIRLCEVATGKELHSFKEDGTKFSSPAFSSDGAVLAMLAMKSGLYLWDTKTYRIRNYVGGRGEEITSFCCAPNSKIMATVGLDSVIQLRNLPTGEITHSLRGHEGTVKGIAFSPDGTLLASVCWGDHCVRVWNTATGKPTYRIHVTLYESNDVRSFAFSPDGKLLALDPSDKCLRVWETSSGNELCRLEGMDGHRVNRPFFPNSRTLVSLDKDDTIRRSDVLTARATRRVETFQESVVCLALSPDGKLLATGDHHGVICLWHADTGQRADPHSGHRNWIRSVAFSPDGKTLASIDGDGAVLLWGSSSGKLIRRLPTGLPLLNQVQFTPDGRSLVLGGFRHALCLWDIERNKLIHDFHGQKLMGWSFALASDGKTLACGTEGGQIILWEVATSKVRRQLGPHGMSVIAVAFSGDGKTIVSAAANDDSIRIWDATSGKELTQFREHSCEYVALSPDSQILAMGGGQQPVFLYETATGKLRHVLGLEGLEQLAPDELGNVQTVSISPDGRTVAAADTGGLLMIWELATGLPRAKFKGHLGEGILALAWSPESNLVATASWDTTALVWDITGSAGRGAGDEEELPAKELAALWRQLADPNSARAYGAVCRLVRNPSQAVSLLEDRLPPVPVPDAVRVAQLLPDLDGELFEVRRNAVRDLEKFGDVIEPALRTALERNPSVEMERRIERLLDKLCGATSAERLRMLRAVEVLEHIGFSEAKRVLKSLASGAPEARLTREAKAALGRLDKRREK